MQEYRDACWDEWCYDEVQVQYWDEESVDDPIYAVLLNGRTWSIISMKTVLEWGL